VKKSSALLLPGISEEAILRWMVLIMAFLVGGLAGVCAIFIAQILMNIANKYERGDASRFGGLVIVSFFYLSLVWLNGVSELLVMSSHVLIVLSALAILFVVGVCQEFFGGFSFIKVALFLYALFGIVYWLLLNNGLTIMDEIAYLRSLPAWFAIVCLLTLLVFFVFAFHTANGANGLVPSTSIFIVMGLIDLKFGSFGSLLSVVAIGCAIFMMFNIVLGQVFIGAGGTYFLGSVLGVAFVYAMSLPNIDVFYLLCLFFYPSVNLLHTMVRRSVKGRFFGIVDKGYLHDLVYQRLSLIPMLSSRANTFTGLLVSLAFACVPMLLHKTGEVDNWPLIYLIMATIYSLSFILLKFNQKREL